MLKIVITKQAPTKISENKNSEKYIKNDRVRTSIICSPIKVVKTLEKFSELIFKNSKI